MNNNTIAKKIRDQYVQREETKLDQLSALDSKVKKPALILAYVLGTIASLILGTGMCLAMEVLGTGLMIPGIVIGLVGIALAVANYFIYNKVLESRRAKYADEIIALSDNILGAE